MAENIHPDINEPAGYLHFREGLVKGHGDQHFWAFIPAENKWVEIADDHNFSFDHVHELETGRGLVYDAKQKGYVFSDEK